MTGPKSNRHKKSIAYYITPHGFGHAVRSLALIRRLLEMDPELNIELVSDIPQFLIDQNVGQSLPYRRKRLDVGLVQLDSIRFDLGSTLRALNDLLLESEALIEEEVRFLDSRSIDLVVSDIPAVAFHAASQSAIPSIGLSNFTWDWIYRDYAKTDPAWEPVIEWLKEGYAKCDLFMQLPMHGDCSACPSIVDVPLIARKVDRSREEVRRILGCGSGIKAYLIAFSGLDLGVEAQRRIESIEGALFFYKHPLRFDLSNGRCLDDLELGYSEVVSAMDAVITKPGYGIIADCLAGAVPMIYSDRGAFAEYDILVREIERQLTTVFMPSENLYEGRWKAFVRELEALPHKFPRLRKDGADVCARIILERLK